MQTIVEKNSQLKNNLLPVNIRLPVVAMASNPTKAQKHVAAPENIPEKPNGIKPPVPIVVELPPDT